MKECCILFIRKKLCVIHWYNFALSNSIKCCVSLYQYFVSLGLVSFLTVCKFEEPAHQFSDGNHLKHSEYNLLPPKLSLHMKCHLVLMIVYVELADFCIVMTKWPWIYGLSKKSLCMTYHLILEIICVTYGKNPSWGLFQKRFLPAIQIRWKLRLAITPLLAIRSQQISAHAMTAQVSCHVQNFVVITVLEWRWEWNEISIKFELRWKNR